MTTQLQCRNAGLTPSMSYSFRFVSMTKFWQRTSHTIRQKSSSVSSSGPA